jgi:hypothetical protein
MLKLIPVETIQSKIFQLRGKSVMLDRHLAPLYGVTTKAFNQAVKRNKNRFPDDFMFQLSKDEFYSLRSQFVTSKNPGRGGPRYLPYAFTEHGVSMLSAILNSSKAVDISIYIVRAFVSLKKMLIDNEALKYAIEGLEKRMSKNERNIQLAINAIQQLIEPPEVKKPNRKMGFTKHVDSLKARGKK